MYTLKWKTDTVIRIKMRNKLQFYLVCPLILWLCFLLQVEFMLYQNFGALNKEFAGKIRKEMKLTNQKRTPFVRMSVTS